MKLIKQILIGGFAFFMASSLHAQQEAQFTQYMDNMLYYNPAYAGSRDALSITALHRQQWVGFDGAPMSTTFSLHTPLSYDNIALGVSVLNDKVGPVNATWINADVSYSLKFKNHNGRLNFGINGGINLLNGDLASLVKADAGDNSLEVRYQNDLKPNLGAGVYYHSDQFFAGFAVPRILDDAKDLNNILNDKYISKRHYYFMVGGYFNASRMLKIRPSAMLKITEKAPLALDLSMAFILYDQLWLGANYRLMESAGVFVQYQINKSFKIGYAFEYSTTKLRGNHYGTHEILLGYDLMFKNKSLSNPRYF